VVVSAASGAVGSVVGQLGKIAGCRVVGIAGGKAKCDYVLNELGFDAVVDYKAGNLDVDLRAAVPKGVDVHFENVGGAILDAMLGRMRVFSRIVVCGLIAEYSATEPYGYTRLRSILVNRIRMQGNDRVRLEGPLRRGDQGTRRPWPRAASSIASRSSKGLENAPAGLIGLLKGENFGKQLVRLVRSISRYIQKFVAWMVGRR
jgi:NADPH-dependent curcumin reductase CurA